MFSASLANKDPRHSADRMRKKRFQRADPNGSGHPSPLFAAADAGNAPVVAALLEARAEPAPRDAPVPAGGSQWCF